MEPEDKDTILPGFEEEILPEASNDPITRNTNNIENEVLPGIGQNSEPEEFLPGFEQNEESEEFLPGFDSQNNIRYQENTNMRQAQFEERTGFTRQSQFQENQEQQRFQMQPEIENVDLSSLLTPDKKIVTFVGTSKMEHHLLLII